MIARFVCLSACVVLAQCLPTKQVNNEGSHVDTIKLNSNLGVEENQAIINELEKEDTKTTALPQENPVVDNKNPENIAVQNIEKTKEVAADKETEKASDKDENLVKELIKVNVKERPDIDTIAVVFNNKIGVDKTYFFKTIHRVEGDEKYKCRVGLTTRDVIFYYRCILISNGLTGEGLEENAPFIVSSK